MDGLPEPEPDAATAPEGDRDPVRAVEARLLRAAARYAGAPQDADARAALLRAARRLRPPKGDGGEDETTTWSGVLVDPAHVRRLEEEVRWVDARAGAVLAAVPDLVLLVDSDGRHLEVHAPDPSAVARPAEQLVGKTLEEVLPAEVAAALRAALRAALETGVVQAVEYALDLGARRHFEARVAACSPGIAVFLVREVTARRLTEAALREREDLLRRTTDAIPGIVYRYELAPSGRDRFTYVSRGCQELFGVSAADALEDLDRLWALLHPEDAAGVQQSIVESARELRPWTHEFRVVVDGAVRWIRGSSVPEGQSPDGTVAWNGFLHDITDVKRLEADLLQSQRLEAVGRLAGGVAHEFNNLLTVIMGAAEALNDLGTIAQSAAAARDLLLVRDAARRGAELVRRLLAFSRKTPVEPRVLDLNDVVRAVEAWSVRVLDERIQLRTSIDSKGPLRVRADAAMLEQALLNLVVNARDALPDGGRILIGTRAAGDEVELVVSDDGLGMAPDVLLRCFEPFFTTKPVGQGTGLGLAACRGIVAQFGGTISAASVPGAGATFTVRLPGLGVEAGTPAPAPRTPLLGILRDAPPPGPSATILVVEDEESVREIVAGILRADGATILEAKDGEEALRVAQARAGLDLLVTDVVMPNLGGAELAMCVRAVHPDLPIVFMSGHSDDVLVHAAVGSNVTFLPKPFTPSALRRAVAEVRGSAPA